MVNETWKRSFLDKLNKAQAECASRFEAALESHVVPAFEELTPFLRDNGFKVSSPLREQGRRSFKFELAENAYLLMIFRFCGVGEFELRCETFVPGRDPLLKKSVGRLADLDETWANSQIQGGLDRFVGMLAGQTADVPDFEAELAAV